MRTQTTDDEPPESPWTELTAFQRDMLVAIANVEKSEQDNYGLAIKRELSRVYDSQINHGRLYPNLDEIKEMGLIEINTLDKRTNSYTLTEKGRESIRARSRELTAASDE